MRRVETHNRSLAARRGRPPRRRRSGAVLVVVLVGTAVLAGLVFFTYNVGDQVNKRLEMQDAADAVAISGGGWIARSMNVVAMNNVAQAKLLGILPVMDSLPQATEMAHDEVTAWEQALSDQLDRGVPDDYLRDGLESLRKRMAKQRDILAPFDQMLNHGDFRMEEQTHWRVGDGDGEPPHGRMWQAMMALGEFSQTAVESAGALAQAQAVRVGRDNHVDAAFLVPVVPQIPAREGEFADFQPVLEGQQSEEAFDQPDNGMGGAIPDFAYPHRLGPWARLIGWRQPRTRSTGWEWVPPREGSRVRGGRGNVNVPGRRTGGSARQQGSGHGGYARATGYVEIGYWTYGPFWEALRRIARYADGWRNQPGELSDTFFNKYVAEISRIKLKYMFTSRDPKSVHVPDWITDYPQALLKATEAATDPKLRVHQTMFYVVEIASSVPEGDPRWLKEGTYRTNGEYPIAIWTRGWKDPASWGVQKVADWIWKDSYTYQTTEDTEIGISLQRDVSGQEIFQTVYMVAMYVFGGIDVGTDEEVSNPANWLDGDLLPAPLLLDTSEGDYDPVILDPDQGIRRDRFTFLGVARKRAEATAWPKRFSNANPTRSTITLAQVKLSNHSSWDLWTQDWRAQLTPVSKWNDWVSRLETSVADAPLTAGLVRQEEVQTVHEYLDRISEQMAERYKSN